MKTKLLTLLFILFFLGISTGCPENADTTSDTLQIDDPNEPDEPEDGIILFGNILGLEPEKEKEIRLAWHNAHPSLDINDDTWIWLYYGTYNDCSVVIMGGRGPWDAYFYSRYEIAAGINFEYMRSHYPMAVKDGLFYRLQDAYDLGMLTIDDLTIMHEIHEHWYYNQYYFTGHLSHPLDSPWLIHQRPKGEDVVIKIFMDFPDLDAAMEDQIRTDYWQTYINPHPLYECVDKNRVWIYQFYGIYNNSAVTVINTVGLSAVPVSWVYETVAGRSFGYIYTRPITVWNDGKFYSLEDAYNLEMLTREDIGSIADKHEALYHSSPLFLWERYWFPPVGEEPTMHPLNIPPFQLSQMF